MQNLDIAIEDARWSEEAFEARAQTAIQTTLTHLKLDPEQVEISILACDDTRITTLNADFRDKPSATNVLSWPSQERAASHHGGTPVPPHSGPDGPVELGDIAISYETCAREAVTANKPIGDHITHLIVHATLHLLGYDHETEQDAAVMEGLEVKILGKLGLDDPYRGD